ncbi:hypothetical protein TGMAS_271470 [Toxoplasma gondii MAS]|uniref:Uncharacterized protein n=1 Tax=Toxoplasma gondii MAS TaxID=943118 RepID=A0A086QVB4_TOXGO|nr:hypothetical protein TGMAS_271470 [Toxoplasma gondii MAS]
MRHPYLHVPSSPPSSRDVSCSGTARPSKRRPSSSVFLRLSLCLFSACILLRLFSPGALAVSVHCSVRGGSCGGSSGRRGELGWLSTPTSASLVAPVWSVSWQGAGEQHPLPPRVVPRLASPSPSTRFASLRPSLLAFVSLPSPSPSSSFLAASEGRGGALQRRPDATESMHMHARSDGKRDSFSRQRSVRETHSEIRRHAGVAPFSTSSTAAGGDGGRPSACGFSRPWDSRGSHDTRRQAVLAPECVSLHFGSSLQSASTCSYLPSPRFSFPSLLPASLSSVSSSTASPSFSSSSLGSSPDGSGSEEAEAEALHRLAGLEMWGEMLSLGAASSLSPASSQSYVPPSSTAASSPSASASLASARSPEAAAPQKLIVSQLPSGEARLQRQHASLSSSYLSGHSGESRKSLVDTFRAKEEFRNSLQFLALPLDTVLFYLVVSPSDGLLFLQDGGPYLLLQHLELQRQRLAHSAQGTVFTSSLSSSFLTPDVDLYDLRYAHHCMRQKVTQAALRLQSQLEGQLLERESARALEAAAGGPTGRIHVDDTVGGDRKRDALESAEGVRGYYALACRLVDEFFAALHARLPRSRPEPVALSAAGAGEEEPRRADLRVTRTEKEALLSELKVGANEAESREKRESEAALAEKLQKIQRTTIELKKAWEVYRQRLFSEDEVPPFERLEILWNSNVSPLFEIREAQGVRDGRESPDRSGNETEKSGNPALLLRLPSLVLHTALAEFEESGRETVLKWVVLKAMLRIFELTTPDAFTLAGGTDLEALRGALKKKSEKLVEAERRSFAMRGLPRFESTVDTTEEDEAIAAATSPPAALVASASLRRKRLEIFEVLEEQEAKAREKGETRQRERASPTSDNNASSEAPLLFPFEWVEGPWLESVLARGQEKRLLSSWLGGASRRHMGTADLFETLLRSQAALSPSEALRFVAGFLLRWPRRPGLSEVQATAALRASEAAARDREQDLQNRRERQSEKTLGTSGAVSPDEEDGEGVFPVQQRALAGALLVGALDKAAGIIEPVSSRLHAQIVSVGKQLVHLRERVAQRKGKSFFDGPRAESQGGKDSPKDGRREHEKPERAAEFLLKAEEKRGGEGFLDSQQRTLLAQLKRQQDEQAALLNLVERQLIAGVFLFLDEAVRFLRPSETSAALDLAALSSSYTPEESERQKQTEGGKRTPHALLDSNRVLQTFVEAQLFIYDVFRSLRVVLHQQKSEAQKLEDELRVRERPPECDDTRGMESASLPSVPFPSLSFLRGEKSEPSVKAEGNDGGEARRVVASPAGADDGAWPQSVALEPDEVPLVVENLIAFYRREVFDDMLPESIQLSLTSHLHDLSAAAFLPALAPRIHPLAIPIQAVSTAIGEAGGRPWHMQWKVYIHEAIRDPALLAYAVLTALFDIWKRTALPPRLPFAAQKDFQAPSQADVASSPQSTASPSPASSAFPSPSAFSSSASQGGLDGGSRSSLSESMQVTPEMAEAQRRSAAELEARTALAERHMHAVGCCQGLRKWLWIRRVSEENGWPFYVGMFRNEMTSDLGLPDTQADATASFTPWLKHEEEALLFAGCLDTRERQIVQETLQSPGPGASVPSSLFARLVSNGLSPVRVASLLKRLVRRSSPRLPHAFPATHVPLHYDPYTACPYRSAAETAGKLQKGVDYDASAASDELSRFRGGRDDDDDDDEQRYGKDVGPTTEKPLTAAEAAAAVARAGTGEQAAETERQGMFPELYRHWTDGKSLARAATYALWGGAKFEAAAAAGAAASGPEVLSEEERKREDAISLWMVKAGEKRMKDAAEAAFRLRLRETATKSPVHSDECINSPAFLSRLSPPVSALAPSEAEMSETGRHRERQFSSLLHKQTADFLTDMVLVDHQLEHARRMRAIRALAVTKNGGDCPEVFEQLLGDAVQQTYDRQLLKDTFSKEELDQLCLGTEQEKKAAEAGKRRLIVCRAEVQRGQQLSRLHGGEREDAARDLFHYFNLKAFHRRLPPDTRIAFSADLADRSLGSNYHPALSDFQQNTSDFREPPTIRLAGSIRSLPVLAHALLQQCILLAASCYDFPSKLHLSPPASVARHLWQYLPPGKAQQKHFAPPPPSGCFSSAGSPHLPPSVSPRSTRGVTPLPASFSEKPPSIASLMNFASQVPSLMQQQQSLGAACRELGKPGNSEQELSLQSKVMAKAKEAAASLSKFEREYEEARERGDDYLFHSQHATATGAEQLDDASNISHHTEAENDIFVEAANAVRAAATDPNGISMEGAGEESGADAVMDAIKQEKVQELQQTLLKLATQEQWPFYVEAPGTTKGATQNSAVGGAPFKDELGGGVQTPPDWQELLNPDEMLKVLKYAVVDREGVASPSLYSDLILSGACSVERAMQIMEQALTVQADKNSVTQTRCDGGS